MRSFPAEPSRASSLLKQPTETGVAVDEVVEVGPLHLQCLGGPDDVEVMFMKRPSDEATANAGRLTLNSLAEQSRHDALSSPPFSNSNLWILLDPSDHVH
jgi:hypothetical protein